MNIHPHVIRNQPTNPDYTHLSTLSPGKLLQILQQQEGERKINSTYCVRNQRYSGQ